MSQRAGPGSTRKRGHQHHPRNDGNRRRAALATPIEDTPPPLGPHTVANVATQHPKPTGAPQQRPRINSSNISATSFYATTTTTQRKPAAEQGPRNNSNIAASTNESVIPSASVVNDEKVISSPSKQQQHVVDVIDLTNCDEAVAISKEVKDERNQKIRKPKKAQHLRQSTPSKQKTEKLEDEKSRRQKQSTTNKHETEKLFRFDKDESPPVQDMSLIYRPAAEGSSDQENDLFKEEPEDPETEELSRLRCTSERIEVVAERESRRRGGRRCADYPGLAFASSIFSSDTLMKFSIIKNELHNIMNTQLRRAESEVAALNRRIQLLEEDLERSEERLATATAKLAEASQAADESERIRKALENRTNMEDDRVGILESQLSQAKLIAEEADKKYEEVARKLVLMEQDLERAEERAEQSESKIVELEEELRVVGNNLKSLEVSEEKAAVTREHSEDKIRSISDKLREAEARAEFAERSVQKLQKEVDRLEDDLLAEKEKNKLLADEMEATLHDIQNM